MTAAAVVVDLAAVRRCLTLTPREAQILTLIADDLTDQQIGHRLGISRRTVGSHVANIICKLGVHSRTGAVVAALRAKAIPL